MSSSTSPLDILIVDDEAVIHDSLSDFLLRCGERVRNSYDGESALKECQRQPPDLVLLDIRLPGADGLQILDHLLRDNPEVAVVMISGHGTLDTAIEAMRLGAVDFLRKPIRLPELMTTMDRVRALASHERDALRLRRNIDRSKRKRSVSDSPGFIGKSESCANVLRFLAAADRVPFDCVLITGETGCGKEVLAQELHRRLRGSEAPLVTVNCPALPENLVESELFGHAKGAFTGADAARAGAFEQAHGGTIFLDELGDLALGTQAKLLRVLESRSLRRLGEHQERAVDVTVIAATNCDLPAMVEAGRFRADLLFRLNTYQIHLPPLRERREDLAELSQHFMARSGERRGLTPSLGDGAWAALQAHDFPGNIRELRNRIERAVMLSVDGVITPELLDLMPGSLTAIQAAVPTAAPLAVAAGDTPPPAETTEPSDPEAAATLAALVTHRWNRRATAEALAISYETLRWRIKKHGLSR